MHDHDPQKPYYFLEPGTDPANQVLSPVEREAWRWVAVYTDGTELHQFDELVRMFHRFQEIDQSKLKEFRMVSDAIPTGHRMSFDPATMQLVHFYRNQVKQEIDHQGEPTGEEIKVRLYCYGAKRKRQDGTVETLLHTINPDGSITTIIE